MKSPETANDEEQQRSSASANRSSNSSISVFVERQSISDTMTNTLTNRNTRQPQSKGILSRCLLLKDFFTLRDKTIITYKYWLAFSLVLTMYTLVAEAMACGPTLSDVVPKIKLVEVILIFLALVLSFGNCIMLLLLIFKRSKRLCICTFLSLLTSDIIYAVQISLFTAENGGNSTQFETVFIVSVAALGLQICPLVVIYRLVLLFLNYYVIFYIWFIN